MNAHAVPADFFTVIADNGDPLLLYGMDSQKNLFLWPTPHLCKHPIAFGRWCKRHLEEFRGAKFNLQHPLDEKTKRWAEWLGVNFEQGTV